MGSEDSIREALEWLRRSPLQSPVRLAIMILLAAHHQMEFTELQRALGLTAGNLWSHIERLKANGLVRIHYKPRLGRGPRLVVEATDEGLRILFQHIRYMRILESHTAAREAEAFNQDGKP